MTTERKNFRYDIQGLRALSALLIIICHIWLNKVSGGIDIFFVISGFFMTSVLLGLHKEKWYDIFTIFWRKILNKIIPTSLLIILLTIFFGYILSYPLRNDLLKDALYTSVFLENIRLIRLSSDYLSNNLKSPFQHFWALSIQFQFYLVYPLLFIIFNKKKYIIISLYFLIFLSFIYSAYLTNINQVTAYYHPTTRIWEFFVGALLFFYYDSIKENKTLSILSTLSIILFILFALFFPSIFNFPGFISIAPVLFACLIISNKSENFVKNFLSKNTILQFISKFSFTLYLVHWPILIYYQYLNNRLVVPILDGLVLILASIVISYIISILIEKPISKKIQKFNLIKFYSIIITLNIFVFLSLFYLYKIQIKNESYIKNSWYSDNKSSETDLKSNLLAIRKIGLINIEKRDYCNTENNNYSKLITDCIYGDIKSNRSIAIVGGSHIEQWIPLFDDFGKKYNYKVIQITKSFCPLGGIGSDKHCLDWSEKAIDYISRNKEINYVIVNSTRTYTNKELKEDVPQTYIDAWKKLRAKSSVKIIGIRDNPSFSNNPILCLGSQISNPSKCNYRLSDHLQSNDPSYNYKDLIISLDYTSIYCKNDICPLHLNNIPIFRDQAHLTSMYVMSITDLAIKDLEKVILK